MKRFPELFLCLAGLFMVGVGRWVASDLSSSLKEVHEWGTMTSVAGSDGRQFAWWGLDSNRLNADAAEKVPEFVQINPLGGKSSFAYVQRMETPVLYFYPTQPISVEVAVQFRNGRITEFFPSLVAKSRENLDTEKSSGPITWNLDLLDPRGDASRLIPPVGDQGAQYIHAREVPSAWLVQRKLQSFERIDRKEIADEVEKFLFYRGASDIATPVLLPWYKENSFQLMSFMSGEFYGENPTPDWWVLHISGDRAAWKRISVPVAEKGSWPQREVDIPELPTQGTPSNLEKTAEELRAEMLPALMRAGLYEDEAKAMLNTWNDTWFKQPGTRILFLLPQKWVNYALPLTIKPKPQKMARVFMARVEMLSPGTEKVLGDALNEALRERGAHLPERMDQVRNLELGRFNRAGFQRVIDMNQSKMEQAAWDLQMRMEK